MNLSTFLSQAPQSPTWLVEVAKGSWQAIPTSMSFSQAADLAMLINGYKLAAALHGRADNEISAASETTRNQRALYAKERRWVGSAAELWVTLFFEVRSGRFEISVGNEKPDTSSIELCMALRNALIEGRLWPES